MTTNYGSFVSTKVTPQAEAIFGKDQVKNSAGGYVYKLDKRGTFLRFLILGAEGNTYYSSQKELVVANAKNVIQVITSDGAWAIDTIVDVSDTGRAPKNDTAIFALALALCYGNDTTKRLAVAAVPKVCRIGTHLFSLMEVLNTQRGWGVIAKDAVKSFYTSKSSGALSNQIAKYQQRNGWSHRDALRLTHLKPDTELISNIFKFAVKPEERSALADYFVGTEAEILWAFQEVKSAKGEKLYKLIRDFKLSREMLPTETLSDPNVWSAMLPAMGLTAMIRNLGNMSKYEVIPMFGTNADTEFILSKLGSAEELKSARIHPIQLLSALIVYAKGSSVKGGGTWNVNQHIVAALDKAFYLSFGVIEPTGKNFMLALDVSGSMYCSEIAGIPGLSPGVASAAMAMVTTASEKNVLTTTFSCSSGETRYERRSVDIDNGIEVATLSSSRRIDDVVRDFSSSNWGGTDCALPMLYALKHKLNFDVFVIYTDNETWAGDIHPSQALAQYRAEINPNAKLIVVGMTATGVTIADPSDNGMLGLVGFDKEAPGVMASFAKGEL